LKPEVETRYGRIRGTQSAGIRCFRGIRYARAARGPLRFQPPMPPEPWKGVQNALEPGPASPQFALPWFGWISAAAVTPGQDCLSLNLWTPGTDSGRRPVVVWIHGGGFLVGSGATPVYDGADLARRGNLVVVTINYRLGALGYAHLHRTLGPGFEESTNLGVRDQIAALEWVRDHAELFGGDPGNVTVMGQSAGAMSIGALLGAPRARKLFHRAICQSGAAENVLEPEEADFVARVFLSELGGPPPSHEALGRIPLKNLLRAQRTTMQQLSDWNRRLMVFQPAVDGDVIPEQPMAAVRRGAIADLPLLLGTTLDEWRLFRMVDPGVRGLSERDLVDRFAAVLSTHRRAPAPDQAVQQFREAIEARGGGTRPTQVWSAFQSARMMHVPAMRLAAAHTAAGGKAHAYLFTWKPPGVLSPMGACHGLDIPFVFGSTGHPIARPLTGLSGAATRLSRKMQYAWIRFAREGQPSQDRLPPWPAYELPRRSTMILGRSCAVASSPLDTERSLLEEWAAREKPPHAEPGASEAGSSVAAS